MDAIKYLDADTILDYLHNSSETYLEGLIPQSYGFPTETDRSVYVRLLKVPVRDKASEVYMQAIPSFHLPCKVNKKTREVFAVEVPAQPCYDDSFRNATVNVDGVDRSLLNLTDIVNEYDSDDYDGVLDALYHVQAKNDYWENDGESLTDLIHKYRWYILKDALMQRGRDAVTDFIGTDISSSEFSRVLDETEMVMPDETFEKFWEKYI